MLATQGLSSAEFELFAKLPFFAVASAGELAEFTNSTRKRTYRRGEVIHHVDDVAGDVFVITSGHVKHRLTAADGRQITHSVNHPGNFFGTMSVIDGRRRGGDAVAITACEVLVIDRDLIARFLDKHPEANAILLRHYVRGLRRMQELLHDQVFLSGSMRLAKVLLDNALSVDGPAGIEQVVPAYLNQTELAFLVGTSRESVNQWLKRFALQGWIETRRREIVVVNPDALRRMVA
jgi:CRP/FNR family transcriptional regulator, cyclic AMP receptor protein